MKNTEADDQALRAFEVFVNQPGFRIGGGVVGCGGPALQVIKDNFPKKPWNMTPFAMIMGIPVHVAEGMPDDMAVMRDAAGNITIITGMEAP